MKGSFRNSCDVSKNGHFQPPKHFYTLSPHLPYAEQLKCLGDEAKYSPLPCWVTFNLNWVLIKDGKALHWWDLGFWAVRQNLCALYRPRPSLDIGGPTMDQIRREIQTYQTLQGRIFKAISGKNTTFNIHKGLLFWQKWQWIMNLQSGYKVPA